MSQSVYCGRRKERKHIEKWSITGWDHARRYRTISMCNRMSRSCPGHTSFLAITGTMGLLQRAFQQRISGIGHEERDSRDASSRNTAIGVGVRMAGVRNVGGASPGTDSDSNEGRYNDCGCCHKWYLRQGGRDWPISGPAGSAGQSVLRRKASIFTKRSMMQ